MEVKEIGQLQFGILSEQEIIRQSVAEITSSKLVVYDKNYENLFNTVYDPRMGPMNSKQICVSCGLKTKDCPGHFGHIVLHAKIVHPLLYKTLLHFLRCFCIQCSRLIISEEHLKLWNLLKLHGEHRFSQIHEIASKTRFCVHCSTYQPKYTFSVNENIYYITYKTNEKHVLTVNEIYKTLSKIINEDVELLGFNPEYSHPIRFILTVLPVIPPRSRPFIITDTISDDDLTLNYCEIIKLNNYLLTENISEIKFQKYVDALTFRIKSLFDNSSGKAKHTNSRPFKGFKERLSGKAGRIRNNMMGKRVDFSARTVIGPDPTLRLNEIAVPREICNILSYPVRVNRFNIEQLQKMIWNGQVNILDKYAPDGSYKRIHVKFALSNPDLHMRQQICTIQQGDVVHRQIMDGDIALLNRQPTLHKGSMLAKYIRIRPGKTIRMNLATTSTFNADFDGDEMNLFFPQSETARAELKLLSATEHNMIGSQASSSLISIVQDALLSSFMMTSCNDEIEPHTFYQMFMRCDNISFDHIKTKLKQAQYVYAKYDKQLPLYCGKTLFSVLLPNTLNYTAQNKAVQSEPILKIERGILYEGAINKMNLKSGSQSLICILYKYYSVQDTLDFVNNVQFLANEYLLYHGFSIGIGDCITDVRKTGKIDDIIMKCFVEADEYNSSIKNSMVREAKINLALSKAKDIGMRIAKESLKEENNFIKTVVSGSKGDYFNIAQIMGLVGQQNIGGTRIQPGIDGNTRTLPHYTHDTTDEYVSKGFIKSSFLKGLSPQEFWFHAMSGREGITDTAMKTAQTGYTQRRMAKIMEDIQIKYDQTVRNSAGSIIQFAYGGDNLCSTKTVLKHQQPYVCDVYRVVDQLNTEFELHHQTPDGQREE